MQQNKNILIINDMPGYGKVALAAMLPILSHMGHNIYNLPTALVSNTLDYGKFTILDTTDYMKKSIAVWKELGFSFDCITTGFLASAEQVDIIRAFIESQRKEDLLVMTDPIMGDEGKLYNGVTEETVENMRRLIGVADVIVPNLTEAEFLTERYRGAEALDRHQAREVVDKARARAASLPADPQREALLEEARWMVEELRVSLFAQTLGTSRKVSLQRITKLVSGI